MLLRLLLVSVFLLSPFIFPVLSESISPDSSPLNSVPPELARWQGWVKHQQSYRDCPSLNGMLPGKVTNHLCAWPGELKISVTDSKLDFTQLWQVLDKSWVPLPGNIRYWPQKLTINAKAATVLDRGGKPFVLLQKGNYQLSGQLSWQQRPEALEIPSQIALLDVSIDGVKQPFVRSEGGRLWLGRAHKEEVKQEDELKLWVNRLIGDGHPMRMTVALQFQVSGRAREVKLTRFSRENYQLMSVQSKLNTRIDSNGDLRVQLNPGEHRLRLEFKIIGFPEQLDFSEAGENWPKQEIWVYQADERLRSTRIEGVSSIDPQQAFVSEWKNLPHYVLSQNDTFKIKQRSRGLSHSGDSLALSRQMWLSFDGDVFYFFDKISGNKSKDWRVNTLQNYQLTQLSNHGKQRLITFDEKQRTGAEIRTPQLDISAGGEVAYSDMNHASGWEMNFSATNVALNIPPGRKLVAVSGADASFGDWVSRWSLIDLFVVLVSVALVFKLFGLIPALFAVVTLGLGYFETGMPVFLWLNLMLAMGLALKLSGEKLSRWLNIYKWLSLGALALALLPFIADQIRFTLYPQLEMNQALSAQTQSYPSVSKPQKQPDQLALEVEEKASDISRYASSLPKKITVTGSRVRLSDLEQSYEQGAVIQAGKGRPGWQWQRASYRWNGPVAGGEIVELFILSEFWVRLLRIVLILFSILWLISVTRRDKQLADPIAKLVKPKSQLASVLAMLAMSAFLSGLSPSLSANNFPDDKLLKQLQQRLYPKAQCEPQCVSVSAAKLTVSQLSLKMEMQYHSGANKAALLPGSKDWQIENLQLNQKPVQTFWKNAQGAWIELPAGVSSISLSARLKQKQTLAINFPLRPKQFQHKISGWQLSGVNQSGLLGSSIQLTQERVKKRPDDSVKSQESNTESNMESREQSISDLVFVTRSFSFANQWKITTLVTRQAPEKGNISIQIPLLPFEQPLQMLDNVVDGNMRVALGPNQNQISWQSSVADAAEFELQAPKNNAIDESWQILVYPNWRINISGVPAVMPIGLDRLDLWQYQYYPRPGEKIRFSLSKPPAVQGESVAFTRIEQEFKLSKRKTTSHIQLNYRATRAEPFLMHIGDSQLKKLTHDQNQINLGQVDGVISIGLKPGEHEIQLTLEAEQAVSFQSLLRGVDIGREYANLSTRVNLPASRWLLAASGPGYGPAVIYWGELIFFLLLAVGLSRLSFSPLNYWQWLLLGLGMSTFSWPAMALVSAWLLAAQWRRQNLQVQTSDDQEKQTDKEENIYQPASSWLILLSTLFAVLALVAAVPFGLLQTPDMGVIGNGSYKNSLLWFLDRGQGPLGEVVIYSLPIWIYKGLMLLWSTWLSFSLIKWLGWIWKDLSHARFTSGKLRLGGSKKNK